MQIAQIPLNEQHRLEALYRYQVHDSLHEADFDHIVKLAAYICKTPIALICLVDKDRQWLKASVGLDESEALRESSFCAHAILQNGPFVVRNALDDERFSDNPLVIGSPKIRFYAGIPLVTPDKFQIGTLCVIDSVPRDICPEQLEALQTLADHVTSLLELRLLQNETSEYRHNLEIATETLRTLGQTLPDMVWLKDPDGTYRFCNSMFERFFGASERQIVGRTDYDFVEKSQADFFRDQDRKAITAGKSTTHEEFRTFSGDSQRKIFEVIKAPLLDKEEKLIGVLGIARDITGRKQAEKFEQFRSYILELIIGNGALNRTLEAIVIGMEQIDPEMICSILLLDSEGKHLGHGIAPDLPDFYNLALAGIEIGMGVGSCGTSAFTGKPVFVNDIQKHPYWKVYKKLAARAGLASCWSQPILSSTNKVLGTFAIYHHRPQEPLESDINFMEQSAYLASIAIERKQAEEQLLIASTAFDTQEGILITDANKVILRYNEAFTRITGYTEEEIIGQSTRILSSGKQGPEFYKAMWETIARDKFWSGEIWDKRKSGEIFPVWLTISAVTGSDGNLTHYVATLSDISESKRSEMELARHRDHLQEMVEEKTMELRRSEAAAKNALKALENRQYALDQHAIVAITDVKGRITYANDRFSAISGYSIDELIGQDHSMINSGFHPKGFWKEMYRTVAKGQPWHAEVCNRNKAGELYWVDTTIVPFMDENGKPKEYISMRTDITDRKRVEMRADAANLAKSEFLANMSHEIRTPMNGVVGMVDILQQTELSREQNRMVRTIRDSALSLLSILNDILDFSKIEAGKMTVEAIPTNLREVTESVAQLMIPITAAKNIDLYVFISHQIPPWIKSDPVRLRQILFNLLGNAVKFTSTKADVRGQVMLRVEPMALDDGHAGIRIIIRDNGIGMSPETQAELFQPFKQADESTTRRFGGTGLGLSITKRLIEMLHGHVEVMSKVGEGAEFSVSLPLETDASEHLPNNEAELSNLTVVAVTTNPAYTEILTAYLKAAGADVNIVKDVSAENFSVPGTVLILDPDLKKEQIALAKTRLSDRFRVVQLIHRRSSSSNATDVTVPVCPLLYHDLIQGVAVAAGRMTAKENTNERRHRQRTLPPTVEEARAKGLLILLAEDNEVNRDVIQEQLNILGYASETAVDGMDALNRWRRGNYGLLLTDCHMPRMDGFQLTAAIRAEETDKARIPIIAVTANAMQGEAERCIENGMDDYLSKPIRLDELGPMLEKWLKAVVNTENVSKATSIPGTTSSDLPIWDATALSRLMGGNSETHNRLLDKFLLRAEETITEINNSVTGSKPGLVANLAHKLKSSARSVGAMQLGELCEQLEDAGRSNDMQTILTLALRLNNDFITTAEQIKKERKTDE